MRRLVCFGNIRRLRFGSRDLLSGPWLLICKGISSLDILRLRQLEPVTKMRLLRLSFSARRPQLASMRGRRSLGARWSSTQSKSQQRPLGYAVAGAIAGGLLTASAVSYGLFQSSAAEPAPKWKDKDFKQTTAPAKYADHATMLKARLHQATHLNVC